MGARISLQKTAKDGVFLGAICFDNPKTLNAQNLQTVQQTQAALLAWKDDPSVAAVVLRGAGDKAFCAGGDIVELYKALQGDEGALACERFFAAEYELIYTLYTYPKAIVAWGSGVIMGGGLGIFAAASHKVATDSALMAMPEISIGLFADAGGSYFLNRAGKMGLFLALTGARWGAADARFLGLADCVMPKDGFGELMDALAGIAFDADSQKARGQISQALCLLHRADLANKPRLFSQYDAIERLMSAGDLAAVDKALWAHQASEAWFCEALNAYKAGSAITKALTWRIHHTVATWSLWDILQLEKKAAIACCARGDFQEGVRALLIDKDKNPAWRYTLQTLPKGYIDAYFGDNQGVSDANAN